MENIRPTTVAAVFAEINGHRLDAPESEVVDMMLKLSAGAIEEKALAGWLRDRLTALGDGDSH